MNLTLLDGSPIVDEAGISVSDPVARAGDGLIETMRARNGVVFRRDAHMARLANSIAELGMLDAPHLDDVDRDIDALLAQSTHPDLRVRVCVGAGGSRWVEAAQAKPVSPAPTQGSAMSIASGWIPSRDIGRHKTVSRAHYAHAERMARRNGDEVALLTDAAGRMGEASTAAVCVVYDGEVLTAPPKGLIPSIGLAALREAMPEILQRPALRDDWQQASEIFTVSAFAGVGSLTHVDGAPVGEGLPGPVARRAAGLFARMVSTETDPPAA